MTASELLPDMFAVEKARLLVQAGADVNAQDQDGRSPLMFAINGAFTTVGDDWYRWNREKMKLLSILSSAGARTGLRNAEGLTALDLLEAQKRVWAPRLGTEDVEKQNTALRAALQK